MFGRPDYTGDYRPLGHGVCFDPLTVGSLLLTGIGGAVSAAGTIAAGAQAKEDAKANAAQMEIKANEERAIAQRQMFEKRRQGDQAISRLRAVAGSSGAGVDDPTVIGLGGDIAGRSEYSALLDMAAGENSARGYETAANAARAKGSAAKTASMWKAGGTILESGSSLFSKYAKTPASRYGYG